MQYNYAINIKIFIYKYYKNIHLHCLYKIFKMSNVKNICIKIDRLS